MRALIQILAALVLLAGCSSESGPPTEPESVLFVEGARLPEVVVEGESASVTVWGTSPEGAPRVETLRIQVLNQPGENPGEIKVSLVTDQAGGSDRAEQDFEITVAMPALEPGDYNVEIAGTHRRHTLQVFPREGWVWYRAIGDPRFPDEGLRILSDGQTMAYREGEGRLGRIRLNDEMLGRIAGWFKEAGFAELENMYIGDEPSDGRILEVNLHDGETRKRVIADEFLAPDQLRALTAQLSDLISLILENQPEPHEVVAHISVDPPFGEMGPPWLLKLTLFNRGSDTVTLTFRTAQLYDFMILRGRSCPDTPGPHAPNSQDLLLWNWAHDMDFAQVLTTLSLEPGEARTFEESWHGLSNEGNAVDAGTYRIEAWIPADVPVPVRPARLVVRGEDPGTRLHARISIDPVSGPEGSERELTLQVTNTGVEPVSITFLSTKQYDFAIEDPRMYRPGFLWLWSYGRGFGDVVFTEEWAPGETKTFTDVWDGTMNDGAVLPAGQRYLLNGWLEVEGHPPVVVARPVPFTVERE